MQTPHSPPRIERLSFASFNPKEEKPSPAAPPPAPAAKTAPAPEPAKPAPPAAPTFSEQQIQAARAEERERGYGEGYAAAEAKAGKEALRREEAVQGLLEVIANRITLAAESHAARRKEQEDAVCKLAIAIAQKLAAGALKREPYAVAESLVRECMGLIAGQPRVIIRVPSARGEGLKQRIGTLTPMLQGFSGELRIEEDSTLGEHDCRIDWNGGYAEHNAQTVWSDIQSIIHKTVLVT